MWNKHRKAEYNMTFPYNNDQSAKLQDLGKFQCFLDLRLHTKGTNMMNKFGIVECPEPNSYRLPWSAFSESKLPQVSQKNFLDITDECSMDESLPWHPYGGTILHHPSRTFATRTPRKA